MGLFDNRTRSTIVEEFNAYVKANGIPESTRKTFKEIGYSIIPKDPPAGLINTIITRIDPSFMNQSSEEEANRKKNRYASAVHDVRDLYAEIAGNGYYTYEREEELNQFFKRKIQF